MEPYFPKIKNTKNSSDKKKNLQINLKDKKILIDILKRKGLTNLEIDKRINFLINSQNNMQKKSTPSNTRRKKGKEVTVKMINKLKS
jgi:hypothetical protein